MLNYLCWNVNTVFLSEVLLKLIQFLILKIINIQIITDIKKKNQNFILIYQNDTNCLL